MRKAELLYVLAANQMHPIDGKGWKTWHDEEGSIPGEPKTFFTGLHTDKGFLFFELSAELWPLLHLPQAARVVLPESGTVPWVSIESLAIELLGQCRPSMRIIGAGGLWPENRKPKPIFAGV